MFTEGEPKFSKGEIGRLPIISIIMQQSFARTAKIMERISFEEDRGQIQATRDRILSKQIERRQRFVHEALPGIREIKTTRDIFAANERKDFYEQTLNEIRSLPEVLK